MLHLVQTSIGEKITASPFIARETMRAIALAAKMRMEGSLKVAVDDANGNPRLILNKGAADDISPMIRIHDPLMIWDVLNKGGSVTFGEAYMDGKWDAVGNLAYGALIDPLTVILRNYTAFKRVIDGNFDHRREEYTKNLADYGHDQESDAKSISEHYDYDGIEFYRPWLGQTMMYSSGLHTDQCPQGINFGVTGNTLDDLQQRKINRIITRLNPKEGETVLEIGCGWGNFGIEVAKQRKANVIGITLSDGQLEVAQRRVFEEGLGERVSFIKQDFRDTAASGQQFDHIASIGMAEHVGDFPGYVDAVKQMMKEGREALLHYITVEGTPEEYKRYLEEIDFMQKYIFTNGRLASVHTSKDAFNKAGLTLINHFSFGPSYGHTLREWNRKFQQAWPTIQAKNPKMFTPRFKRMWEFYLCACAASFYAGTISVNHFHLYKGGQAPAFTLA
ncbi:MAG: cyclopropane-fatty-acyl-phospholipid synthase family protein [Alphaproteobacteria bacterium]|nr:cyclopropane-fatty-acyl-phospholipid synthase family protein [Alphaproteobacteria bacterium]